MCIISCFFSFSNMAHPANIFVSCRRSGSQLDCLPGNLLLHMREPISLCFPRSQSSVYWLGCIRVPHRLSAVNSNFDCQGDNWKTNFDCQRDNWETNCAGPLGCSSWPEQQQNLCEMTSSPPKCHQQKWAPVRATGRAYFFFAHESAQNMS